MVCTEACCRTWAFGGVPTRLRRVIGGRWMARPGRRSSGVGIKTSEAESSSTVDSISCR